jgi:HD-GYP domain-containing protein (c-di-GMP phosphodiesterase class II)
MTPSSSDTSGVRLAELMAALSLATDLGVGQPLEFGLRACVLAVRLGETLGGDEHILRDVYYEGLLRYIGCNAETHILASIMGDELSARAGFAKIDLGQPTQILDLVLSTIREANAGQSSLELARAIARGLLALPGLQKSFAEHCEVAQRLAERMGFHAGLIRGLGQLYERWDGKGLPNGVKGEDIAIQVRIVTLAQDVIVLHRFGGLEGVQAVVKERNGAAYDPRMVQAFCANAPRLLAGLDDELSWNTVLALEPGEHTVLTNEQFDRACLAIADFADMKSPYLLGHSSGVATLAGEAALRVGLTGSDVTTLRRAGWLHDIGRTGVSVGIWDKVTPLSDRDRERVRLHPYYTERVLAQSEGLARLGALAASHHERLDRSGYHRGLPATLLPVGARLLAAADVYHALCEPRPHRAALAPEAAATQLRAEVRAGKLDGNAVDAVLAVAGHPVASIKRERVAGLTDREMQVLRLVARGESIKQIARRLDISAKTTDNHIQHIYAKIGVSTRAAAALFAVEHNLLADIP